MQVLLEALQQEAINAINSAPDLKELEQCRVYYLGKKSKLTEQLKELGKLSPHERPAAGQVINQIKQAIESAIQIRLGELSEKLVQSKLASESIDITLPGRDHAMGTLHPISLAQRDLKKIFTTMGFAFMTGPEIETDYYNFTALNVPPFHPARAMQDTFYFSDGLLLRSQMSPVQIHAMRQYAPPFRMIAMGRVYRRDYDLTHTPMFHQLECLLVSEQVTFSDLKGLLETFLQTYFEADFPLRFRPSYFPFTEPSAEVDIRCIRCKGNGCRICKQTGWLEVLGCGMVHPNVLRGVEIDPNQFKGFAFGLGIDRLAMLKYSISDLRSLFENDIRFLSQF